MLRPRIIPLLLMQHRKIVKTVQFANPRYIGDPINAARVFNGLNVDELCLLDIAASKEARDPDYDYLARIADDCFMPLSYGGGIAFLNQARQIIELGIERVILNSFARPGLVQAIAGQFGSQAVAVCIDAIWTKNGFRLYRYQAGFVSSGNPIYWARRAVKAGAGEILLQSVDDDGMMTGYDRRGIQLVSEAVSVPVVAAGGAGKPEHFKQALDAGASACAAGSMFVYHGPHKAVLLNYERGTV